MLLAKRLYSCTVLQSVGDIWCVTLRKEHVLREFESWVLREIFGPKGNKAWSLDKTA
jgi:hypothetical protein